jgi:hypothetical protein
MPGRSRFRTLGEEAQRFLTACTSWPGLLEKPNVSPVPPELRQIRDSAFLLGLFRQSIAASR